MIKINTIYRTKKDCFIVIIRNPKYKCYELFRSVWMKNLQDVDYLLNECNPIFFLIFFTTLAAALVRLLTVNIFQLDK